MTGELEFAGTLRIDGDFHGSISTGDVLIIGEHAIVHADIKAGEVELHGQVFGNIDATRRVEIAASGRLRGDVRTPILGVTVGSVLDGHVQMTGNPIDETAVDAHAVSQQRSHQETD